MEFWVQYVVKLGLPTIVQLYKLGLVLGPLFSVYFSIF